MPRRPLTGEDLVEVAGVAVRSPARTVADLARAMSFASAVVAADAALRVLSCADRRSEIVGESRSRVLPADLDLAPTTLQHDSWPTGGGSPAPASRGRTSTRSGSSTVA